MHVWDSYIACWNARLSVETNSFTNPIVCTEISQDRNFPPIVRINCSIIWSNNFLLAVTTDFPLWESSYSKWRFYYTALHLSFTEDSIALDFHWKFYCTALLSSFTSVCDGLHNTGLFLFSLGIKPTFFLMPMLRKCASGYFPDSLWLWEWQLGGYHSD